MMEVRFTKDSKAEDLFCGTPLGSNPSLFFSDDLFGLNFNPVQDDFQQDFTRMTDMANSSVALAEL